MARLLHTVCVVSRTSLGGSFLRSADAPARRALLRRVPSGLSTLTASRSRRSCGRQSPERTRYAMPSKTESRNGKLCAAHDKLQEAVAEVVSGVP